MSAEEVAQIWAGVDELTKVSTVAIERDDGTRTYAKIPSLWEQSNVAISGRADVNVRTGSAAERSPVDLNLLEVRSLIRNTTQRAIRTRQQIPRPGVPAQLRQLASLVVGEAPDRHWWWAYRFPSWARLLRTYLDLSERTPMPVRLRGSACPSCGTRQVSTESDDGLVIVPALVIDFRQGFVRAAECAACHAHWWRGAELEALAVALGMPLLGASA
jgi:hypothetical protein